MLCTKICLTERRRNRFPHTFQDYLVSPIVRPCATKDMIECSTRNTISATAPDGGKIADSPKTPLIIVTLSISPDIKTLAPKDLKRYPRKMPSFCRQRNISDNNSCTHQNDFPGFFVKGIDIREKNMIETGLMNDLINQYPSIQDDPVFNGECHCFDNNPQITIESNLSDGYVMDCFGHIPGYSRTPSPQTPQRRRGKLFGHQHLYHRRHKHRSTSPSTDQVIRITVNDKINDERK